MVLTGHKQILSDIKKKIPDHVAIIMDGNRRWAKRRGMLAIAGHKHGVRALTDVVEAASDLGVKVVTAYTFSTENWSRSQNEVSFLMKLMQSQLKSMCSKLVKNRIRLSHIGDIDPLPIGVKSELKRTMEKTSDLDGTRLVLAINYGGRNDICRAVKKIVDDIENKSLSKERLSEAVLSSYLDTSEFGDPDLLIRTGGESRVSNFLLWQISYSEIYISKVLWPDFSKKDFVSAIEEFQMRESRLGG